MVKGFTTWKEDNKTYLSFDLSPKRKYLVEKTKMDDGVEREYVRIDNPFAIHTNDTVEMELSKAFHFAIADAVNAIRDGFGDEVYVGILPFCSSPFYEVRFYLDRSYGDQVRERSVRAWDGIKFGYCVVYTNKNGTRTYYVQNGLGFMIPTSMHLWTSLRPLAFSKRENAESFITSVFQSALIISDEVLKRNDSSDKKRLHAVMKSLFVGAAYANESIHVALVKRFIDGEEKSNDIYTNDIRIGQSILFDNSAEASKFKNSGRLADAYRLYKVKITDVLDKD